MTLDMDVSLCTLHVQQEVVKEQEWGPVQSKPDRPYADLQGLYVSDMPDGEEHHNWQDGSEYYGEWRDGQPNGRGIFVSQSGQAMYCYLSQPAMAC
jgi:hypothetical protein